MNPPTYTSNIEVLLQAFRHFEERLTHGEKDYFLESIARYREGKISICGIKNIIALWIARDEDQLLGNQTFFMPFPDDLVEPDPTDTDRGCNLWKEQE